MLALTGDKRDAAKAKVAKLEKKIEFLTQQMSGEVDSDADFDLIAEEVGELIGLTPEDSQK